MPGSSRSRSGSVNVASDWEYLPISAAKTACVPHSANATTLACGNAACSPLLTPGRPKCAVFAAVSATSRHIPSIATSRRPASHTSGVCSAPIGLATRSNSAANGSDPRRARAWKIADLLGNEYSSRQPDAHDSPSVSCASTSSYEPSEYSAIPIEKYAITRAGSDRCRCSVRPTSAITSSTRSGGNTRVSTPTDTRSDNRRSDSGSFHPALGMPPNYTDATLTERYWG